MSDLERMLTSWRFGLGGPPGTGGTGPDGLRKALLQGRPQQGSVPPVAWAGRLPSASDILAARPGGGPDKQNARRAYRRRTQALFEAELAARLHGGLVTEQAFHERLVWFWSNHFTVSVTNPAVRPLAGAFEREAIRPHVLGRFEDMLLAAAQHPAMLVYLDNNRSVGPQSPAGKRRKLGLNENLAREILELHTLGVDGGYTQSDVEGLARLLTGWHVAPPQERTPTGFRYRAAAHEPGTHVLLGQSFRPTSGPEQGQAALKMLAAHPATAAHIAAKFARHFHPDPPSEAIKALERRFRETGGDLRALALTLVQDDRFWRAEPGPLRPPIDYLTAVLRLVGRQAAPDLEAYGRARLKVWGAGGSGMASATAPAPAPTMAMGKLTKQERFGRSLTRSLQALGQLPFSAPSPKGWPEDSRFWGAPDAVLERVEWANSVSKQATADLDVVGLADQALGPLFRPDTRLALLGAASQPQALALLMLSPEVQRR